MRGKRAVLIRLEFKMLLILTDAATVSTQRTERAPGEQSTSGPSLHIHVFLGGYLFTVIMNISLCKAMATSK